MQPPQLPQPSHKDVLIMDMLTIFTVPSSHTNSLDEWHEFLRHSIPLFDKETLAKMAANIQMNSGLSSISHILRHVIDAIPTYTTKLLCAVSQQLPAQPLTEPPSDSSDGLSVLDGAVRLRPDLRALQSSGHTDPSDQATPSPALPLLPVVATSQTGARSR
jgi:hypothetical protein